MIKIENKLKEISKRTKFAECFPSYDGSTIGDAITSCADDNVEIYYSQLHNWLSDNTDKFEDALNEFGWDGCGKDFYKAIQTAQFMDNERTMYDQLDDIMLYYVLNSLKLEGLEEITEKQLDELESYCMSVDNNERLDVFYEKATDEVFGEEFMNELKGEEND